MTAIEEQVQRMPYLYADGGRSHYFTGRVADDCVTRATAIAAGRDYKVVYDELFDLAREYADTHRDKVARAIRKYGASPREGVHRKVYEPYIVSLGFTWVPCMAIGTGCQVRVRADELPSDGSLILRLSKHLSAVVEGILMDTYDPSREGWRCVYGYWERDR